MRMITVSLKNFLLFNRMHNYYSFQSVRDERKIQCKQLRFANDALAAVHFNKRFVSHFFFVVEFQFNRKDSLTLASAHMHTVHSTQQRVSTCFRCECWLMNELGVVRFVFARARICSCE